MAAVLATFELKPGNITACEGMPFQQHFEARVDRPLDDLDMDRFFAGLQDMLRIGDQITVCAYFNDRWDQLMQVGVCRIINKANKEIQAAWVGGFVDVPQPSDEKKQFENKERKLYSKKEFGGGYTVQDDKGNVIERFKTKAEAHDYIKRLNEPLNPSSLTV